MISFDKLKQCCPMCQGRWNIEKTALQLYSCVLCKIDMCTNKFRIIWLRKGFTSNYQPKTQSTNCFFWDYTSFPFNYYVRDNGKYHDIDKDIDISLDIQQHTLETLINFS